jgi:CRISPR-associated endoribonuclease Cas6
LRFTALTAPVSAAFQRNTEAGGAWAAGATLSLAGSEFRVEADARPNPWAAAATYEALSAPWLLGRATPDQRLSLRFSSPTTFKSAERHVPVPLPQWVWGSLLEKWNAFAPVALPPEARRFAEECLALTAYQLQTRMVPLKEGGLRAGAVGWTRYTALNRDRYWLSVIHLLADFALYAGVGVGAAMGLGQCRREVARESGPPAPTDRRPRAASDEP